MITNKIKISFFVCLIIVVGTSYYFGFKKASEGVDGNNFAEAAENLQQEYNYSTSQDLKQYDEYYSVAEDKEVVKEKVYSAVVPHHLVAGKYIATLFNVLAKQNPELVVIIGPNHKNVGESAVLTTALPYKTPYGDLVTDQELAAKLVASGIAKFDDKVVNGEHSVGALIPFVKNSFTNARVVPIILKSNTPSTTVVALVQELKNILPAKSLVLASIDFSHYLPAQIADFHDETAVEVLESGDNKRVDSLEVDSKPSVLALLAYNKLMGAEKFYFVSHTNSGRLMQADSAIETTSHLIGYYAKGENVKSDTVTMQFFGDIMLDRNVAKAMGKKGLSYIFEPFQKSEYRFFRGADLMIANLEGPFAKKRIPTSKSIAFRFDPKFALELQKFGFDAVDLANNHSYDMGRANVLFTRDTLKAAGVGYFGDELNEGADYTYFDDGVPGMVAILGVHNTYHEPDRKKLLVALIDAKSKAKTIIVNVHWGEEYKRISNTKQRELAHWLIDNGATAVIGHHPHVVQEMELYKGKPIFYSLGNFIFDQYFSKDTQEGLSVGLVVKNGVVEKIYLFPVFGVKSKVDIMTGARRNEFWEWMNKNSRLGEKRLENGVLEL